MSSRERKSVLLFGKKKKRERKKREREEEERELSPISPLL